MIQVTATSPEKSGKATKNADTGELLNLLLDQESLRQRKPRGPNRPPRQINRTKLLAGFLKVCNDRDRDPRRSERAISELCKRALEAANPANELIGTFLAALEISPENAPRIRATLKAVMSACSDKLSDLEPQTCI